tara:strand:- start:35 stop:463 length:429 start_codon:yes stop_codon:yes gene_type:complete
MAQFGFGLNTIKTAQETGYDQYKTSLFESLGAVASDNWNFNPAFSIKNMFNIGSASTESREAGLLPIDKNLLNEEYRDLGLFFERNEYQSVVDIMVAKKRKKEKDKVLWKEVHEVLGILYLVVFMLVLLNLQLVLVQVFLTQ